MIVRVVLRVDIDLDAYRAEYGDPSLTADDAREDIRSATASAVATDGVVMPAGIILDVEDIAR